MVGLCEGDNEPPGSLKAICAICPARCLDRALEPLISVLQLKSTFMASACKSRYWPHKKTTRAQRCSSLLQRGPQRFEESLYPTA
ncbi:hypothetical protein ANN_26960 [Periplaneta americana]|uniref:Uncharacterized protein n=1 Tax=Periplaneta americana TaxID=6978 RepID=A0ABQ8RWT6_PERAM|nr:hypothetical protein ANN_26960 [Periplaneta americana]